SDDESHVEEDAPQASAEAVPPDAGAALPPEFSASANSAIDSLSARLRRVRESVDPIVPLDPYRGVVTRPIDVSLPGVNTPTPLPEALSLRSGRLAELGIATVPMAELEALQADNVELRKLVEQAVVIEEEYERAKAQWASREQELSESNRLLTEQ